MWGVGGAGNEINYHHLVSVLLSTCWRGSIFGWSPHKFWGMHNPIVVLVHLMVKQQGTYDILQERIRTDS